MKYLIILLMLYGCDESFNPTSIEKQNQVTVYLELIVSHCSAKTYCEGQIVSFIEDLNEKDTIKVPNGAELKARICVQKGYYTYKTTIARNGLTWKLP